MTALLRYASLALLLLLSYPSNLPAKYYEKFCERTSYFCIGEGYYWSGKRWDGSVLQLEYKSPKSFLRCFHSQTGASIFEFRSFLIYSGIDVEIYFTDALLLNIDFSPGIYFKGSGRDLGFPIEFRSCMELAYQWKNRVRIGGQLFHVSNAHLGGNKNPGLNAVVFSISLPL